MRLRSVSDRCRSIVLDTAVRQTDATNQNERSARRGKGRFHRAHGLDCDLYDRILLCCTRRLTVDPPLMIIIFCYSSLSFFGSRLCVLVELLAVATHTSQHYRKLILPSMPGRPVK